MKSKVGMTYETTERERERERKRERGKTIKLI